MTFEWKRMHKWEENLEGQITDAVFEFVCEQYGVEEVTELTVEQFKEVNQFYEEMNEYSVMHIGFVNLTNHWQDENEWLD